MILDQVGGCVFRNIVPPIPASFAEVLLTPGEGRGGAVVFKRMANGFSLRTRI
jgi:hypothetical protein